MTRAQKRVIEKLNENPQNRIIEFADHIKKRVRYALQYWENNETDYIFPDPRTVESLYNSGVLVRENGSDIIVLSQPAT